MGRHGDGGGELPLQGERVRTVGQGAEPAPQRGQLGDGRHPDQCAGVGPAQVLCALDGVGAEGEAEQSGGEHRQVVVAPGGTTGERREDLGGAHHVEIGVEQRRPGTARGAGADCDAGESRDEGVAGWPLRRTRPAAPLALARPRNRETYGAVRSKTLATSRPDTPASVRATTARLRMPTSSSSEEKTRRVPKETTLWPSTELRRSTVASGIPASSTATLSNTPKAYRTGRELA